MLFIQNLNHAGYARANSDEPEPEENNVELTIRETKQLTASLSNTTDDLQYKILSYLRFPEIILLKRLNTFYKPFINKRILNFPNLYRQSIESALTNFENKHDAKRLDDDRCRGQFIQSVNSTAEKRVRYSKLILGVIYLTCILSTYLAYLTRFLLEKATDSYKNGIKNFTQDCYGMLYAFGYSLLAFSVYYIYYSPLLLEIEVRRDIFFTKTACFEITASATDLGCLFSNVNKKHEQKGKQTCRQ